MDDLYKPTFDIIEKIRKLDGIERLRATAEITATITEAIMEDCKDESKHMVRASLWDAFATMMINTSEISMTKENIRC